MRNKTVLYFELQCAAYKKKTLIETQFRRKKKRFHAEIEAQTSLIQNRRIQIERNFDQY